MSGVYCAAKLLGQGSTLHVLVSFSCPSHSSPPPIGGGLSHARSRDVTPPPHSAEQSVKADHSPQQPLTDSLSLSVPPPLITAIETIMHTELI